MASLKLRGRFDPGEGRILLAMMLAIAAVEGTRPTASYRAIELGAGALEIGVVAGAFAALAFAAALPIGRAIDRIGERWFLVTGASLLILAATIGFTLPFIAALVAMQATLGLGQVCMSISAQALAGNSATSSGDHRFARLAVAVAGGHLLGPLLVGMIIDGQLPLFGGGTLPAMLMMGTFGLSALLVSLSVRSSSPSPLPAGEVAPERVGVGKLIRLGGMPQALYVGIVALTTLDLLVAYLPVVGEERGIAPSVVGYLLATRAGATVLSRLSMGALLDKLGRRRLLLGAMAVSGVSIFCLATPLPVAMMFVLMGIGGFALGVGMPMTTAWVSSRAPTGSRGVALGLRITGNRVGQVVVPVALGGVAVGFGAGAIFMVAGVALGLGSVLVRSAPLGNE